MTAPERAFLLPAAISPGMGVAIAAALFGAVIATLGI